MYTAFPISLRAGQVGVLTFTAGADATLGTIEGAIFESDPDAPDAPLPPPTPCVVQKNVLYIPPLPVGMHLFEVRVDGGTVVYQHVEVQPSPLGDAPGSATWEVVVTRVGGEWHFSISTPAGPAGAPGKSAYDIWIAAGNVGSEADFLASLQGPAGRNGRDGQDGKSPSAAEVAAELIPMISSELAYEGPAATNNWHASYFQLGENYLPQGTALSEFGYRVRFDSLNGCTITPVYLGIWELAENGVDWELRGVSTNTQVQALSSDVLWNFDPSKVRLSGRPIRCCLMESREDGWRTDLTMGMRVSSATGANTAIFYNEQSWTSVPKFFLRGYKPAENITMGGGGSEGGGGGSSGVDEGAVREIAAEEVEKALYDSVPGEIVLAAEASDNINCVSLELDPIHTPTARVSTIRLLARDAGAVSGQAVYLSAWEQVSGEDYKLLAVSTNTQVQVAGQWSVWEFANLRLSGKRMRYAALATPSTPFAQASTLYMRCAPRPEGDSSLIHTSSSPFAYLPAMAIVTATGDAIFAPASHPQDAQAHLTKEEHARLTEMLESGGDGTGAPVDQDYIPTSPRAQSGRAVAQALYSALNETALDYKFEEGELEKGELLFQDVQGTLPGAFLKEFSWRGAYRENVASGSRINVYLFREALDIDSDGFVSAFKPYAYFTQISDLVVEVDTETEDCEFIATFSPPVDLRKAGAMLISVSSPSTRIIREVEDAWPLCSLIYLSLPLHVENRDGDLKAKHVVTPCIPFCRMRFDGVLKAHENDTTAHLTNEEHARLTEILESGGDGTGAPGGENDTTPQLSKDELTQLRNILKEYKEGSLGGGNSNHSGTGQNSIALGYNAEATGGNNVSIGCGSYSVGSENIAIGAWAYANGAGAGIALGNGARSDNFYALSIGPYSKSRGWASTALGYSARANDDGVLVLAASVEKNYYQNRVTQLYLIPRGSSLSNQYTGGEAALGYIVADDANGDNEWDKIIESGTRKLSELLTDNRGSFMPDLSAPY